VFHVGTKHIQILLHHSNACKNSGTFILDKLYESIDCCDLGVTNYMPEYKSKKRKRRDLTNTTVITGFDSSSSES